jgi:hypothetical protein
MGWRWAATTLSLHQLLVCVCVCVIVLMIIIIIMCNGVCFTGTGDLQNFCTPEYPENTWNIESYVVDEYTMAQNKVRKPSCTG